VTSRTLGLLELVLAGAAAAACVVSWVSASTSQVVAPVIAGEPSKSAVVYDPPMIMLALVLATVAGVLAVAGGARLRRG
jgi:hypothetical protein